MTIFDQIDYRSFLKEWFEEQKNKKTGLLTKASTYLRCQNSHLTRVLKQEVHLTPDQAYLFTRFTQMSEKESHYFMKLVEHNRASNLEYKNKLEDELKNLKRESKDLSRRHPSSQIHNSNFEMLYYSDWIYVAIHMLITVPEYQSALNIAKRLNITESEAKNYLAKLSEMGLAYRDNLDHWHYTGGSIHLPKTSPMSSVNHNSWRERAIYDSRLPTKESIHYTVTQSVSKNDYEKIKNLIIETIDRYKLIAEPSAPEEVICLCLDVFKI